MKTRKTAKRPMLSACAIVKNEAKNLPRWLCWAKLAADEIIVVDTGSTDETVALAEAAGARVYTYPWQDDFAAAKNFALDQATGDWIAFLDADEYFSDADAMRLKDILARQLQDTEVILTRCVNIDADHHDRVIDESTMSRLFRRTPALRYHGRIHEHLITAGRVATEPTLTIFHTGYSPSILAAKAARNLAMLTAECKRRPKTPMDDYYLMSSHYECKHYEEAVRYARIVIESGVSAPDYVTRPYSILIRARMLLGAPQEEVLQTIDEACAAHPGAAEFSFLRGIYLFDKKAYVAAERAFLRGMREYKAAQAGTTALYGNQAHSYVAHAYWSLGQLAMWQGDKEKAIEYWSQGIRTSPYVTKCLPSLLRAFKDAPARELIAFLDAIYEMPRDASFLAERLAAADCGKAAIYYDEQANGAVLSRAESLYFAKQYAAMAAEIEACIEAGVWCMHHHADALTENKRAAFSLLLP